MKVLLLEHPRTYGEDRANDIANAPLSACLNTGYIGAMLRSKKVDVTIVDGYLEGLDYPAIEKKIAGVKPTILGIHLVYHWENNQTLYHFIEGIKSIYAIEYIIVYGFYPTFAYQEILEKCPAIDSVSLGESELTFSNLVENFPNDQIQGVARRQAGEIVVSHGGIMANLDSLPFPLRTKESYPAGEVNILGSRGCYGDCTFCYINSYYGDSKSKWRGRSPENIMDEIDMVINETGLRYFYFVDPNFFGPGRAGKDRVLKLAELLKKRNINFGIEARPNDIEEETIGALVDAGLCHILIGLESGRDESLKRLNKKTSVADNEKALKILRKYGIEPSVGFIMFEPESTIQDLKINYDFLKRNDLLRKLETSVNVLYHHMIILQGSAAYRILAAQGRLNISDHSTYEADTDYLNPKVATLAGMMRDMTNHIFSYLKENWELSVKKDPQTLNQYNQINQLLVSAFADLLKKFNATDLTIEKCDIYIKSFNQKIDSIMS